MNGLHLIADLYRCNPAQPLMIECERLEALCVEECRAAGLTPLGAYFYQFRDERGEPAGVTGTVVLAESHLAIHTWPEYGYAAVDVFTCGDIIQPEDALNYLKEAFGAGQVSTMEMKRGQVDMMGIPAHELRVKPVLCA